MPLSSSRTRLLDRRFADSRQPDAPRHPRRPPRQAERTVHRARRGLRRSSPPAAFSEHLAALRDSGLVTRARAAGRHRIYAVTAGPARRPGRLAHPVRASYLAQAGSRPSSATLLDRMDDDHAPDTEGRTTRMTDPGNHRLGAARPTTSYFPPNPTTRSGSTSPCRTPPEKDLARPDRTRALVGQCDCHRPPDFLPEVGHRFAMAGRRVEAYGLLGRRVRPARSLAIESPRRALAVTWDRCGRARPRADDRDLDAGARGPQARALFLGRARAATRTIYRPRSCPAASWAAAGAA